MVILFLSKLTNKLCSKLLFIIPYLQQYLGKDQHRTTKIFGHDKF